MLHFQEEILKFPPNWEGTPPPKLRPLSAFSISPLMPFLVM